LSGMFLIRVRVQRDAGASPFRSLIGDGADRRSAGAVGVLTMMAGSVMWASSRGAA